MMRFKKGSKVEVMNRKEMPISWRAAEILSGDRHTYIVKYDCYQPVLSEAATEMVPRTFVRPCQPCVQGLESWVAGDVIEVFDEDDLSWKIAAVLKVLHVDRYLVRLLGSSREFSIHGSKIRVRLLWLDGKWIVRGKGSPGRGDLKTSRLSSVNYHRNMTFEEPDLNVKSKSQAEMDIKKNAVFQDSPVLNSRSLKRTLTCCSATIEAQTGNANKVRAVEKEFRRQGPVPAPLLDKVDAVAYPGKRLGEKYMHASFNNISNGYNELESTKLDHFMGHCKANCEEANDSDSDASSVGSCSVVSCSPTRVPGHSPATFCQKIDSLCSDAESSFGLRYEEESSSLLQEEGIAADVHRLEVHAYRCTLEALHASGPLSWDREAVLTNLRIMLHISNDEHLMELKHLISAKTQSD